MITAFHRLRKKLLEEHRFGRYLVYAAGEILLIVTGILFALAINNWNQDRLTQLKEKTYLTGLRDEFNRSRLKLETLIEVNRMTYEASRKIADHISRETQPDEQELSGLLFKAVSYELDYRPNNSLLRELINSGGLKDISNADLRIHLASWESVIQGIQRQEGTLRTQRENVLDNFRSGGFSIRTILEDTGMASSDMGLEPGKSRRSNLDILHSLEFENCLLIYILTSMITETTHYEPLLEEIDAIMELIAAELP